MIEKEPLSRAEERFLSLLKRELQEYLYLLAAYGPISWEVLYVSPAIERRFDQWVTDLNPAGLEYLVDQLREENRSNQRRERMTDIGRYRCSLHLFDRWMLIHFVNDANGMILGVDSRTAPNLRGFIGEIHQPLMDLLDDADRGSAERDG